MRIEDGERALHAAAQEFGDRRLAGLHEAHHEAQRRDVAGELVVIPQDPAHDLSPVFTLELMEMVREMVEDYARLRKVPGAVLEYRHLAHLVDVLAVGRGAGL